MAAPNIVAVTSIYGKTAVQIITTDATAIVSNSAASGKVLKVNSIVVANVNGVSTTDVTVDLYRSSVAYRIAYLVAVPPKSTLIVIGKDTPIYLEEGDSIRITGSANTESEAIASYEEIS